MERPDRDGDSDPFLTGDPLNDPDSESDSSEEYDDYLPTQEPPTQEPPPSAAPAPTMSSAPYAAELPSPPPPPPPPKTTVIYACKIQLPAGVAAGEKLKLVLNNKTKFPMSVPLSFKGGKNQLVVKLPISDEKARQQLQVVALERDNRVRIEGFQPTIVEPVGSSGTISSGSGGNVGSGGRGGRRGSEGSDSGCGGDGAIGSISGISSPAPGREPTPRPFQVHDRVRVYFGTEHGWHYGSVAKVETNLVEHRRQPGKQKMAAAAALKAVRRPPAVVHHFQGWRCALGGALERLLGYRAPQR